MEFKLSLDSTDLKILIIDDLEENRFLMRSFLKKIDLNIDEASSGFEGVKRFKDVRYDLILLDIHMPEMDGYEVIRTIRDYEDKNKQKRTKIIAVTAYAWENDFPKMMKEGFDHYIAKPIDKKNFINAIRSIVCLKCSPQNFNL